MVLHQTWQLRPPHGTERHRAAVCSRFYTHSTWCYGFLSHRGLFSTEGQARVFQIGEGTLCSLKKKESNPHLLFNGPVGLLPKGNGNSPTVLRQNTRKPVKEVFVIDFEPNRRRKAVVWLFQLPVTAPWNNNVFRRMQAPHCPAGQHCPIWDFIWKRFE